MSGKRKCADPEVVGGPAEGVVRTDSVYVQPKKQKRDGQEQDEGRAPVVMPPSEADR